MRILVTGHEGFVGSHVSKALCYENDVYRLDRHTHWYEDWAECVTALYGKDELDALILVGAISSTSYDKADIMLWNVDAPRLMAKMAWEANPRCHVIFFSSSSVPLTEFDPHRNTPYSWSKRLAERFLGNDANLVGPRGIRDLTILRPSIMWGNETGFTKGSRSVPFQIANHDLRHMWRGRKRDCIHIKDVVTAIKQCLARKIVGTYELISGVTIENDHITEAIQWKGWKIVEPPENAWLDQYEKMSTGELARYYDNRFPIVCKHSIENDLPELERQLNNEYRIGSGV